MHINKVNIAGKELEKVIDSNWFTVSSRETPRFPPAWNFEHNLKCLSIQTFPLLLRIHFIRIGVDNFVTHIKSKDIATLKSGKGIVLEGKKIAFKDLVTTLKMIAVSEYYIDSLLYYPREIRNIKIAEIATILGTNSQDLIKFCFKWHDQVRNKIYYE